MNDPLSMSLDGRGVDTAVPILPEGEHPFQIAESVLQPNKDQTGLNWHLKLALTEPRTAPDGKPVNVNYSVFMDLACQAKEGSTDAEAFKRGIFQTQDSISGTDASTRPVFNHDYVQSVVGKNVIASIAIDEWPKGSGNFNNKVRRLKKQ